jgi:hypothetical protein
VIDASGELDGVRFSDAAGLGRAMHDNPATASCLISRMYSYGVGREPAKEERPLLKYFGERFANQGYRVPDLMKTIALSNAFRAAAAPEPAAAPAKTALLSTPPGLGQTGEHP